MLRRSSPSSSATLTGGDLSVDILHTEDSVRIGDGTDLLSLSTVGATKTIPVDVKATVGATDATLTGGSQRSKITDGTDNVEIDDVGGEKALKVSVIASVGGGGGGTAATDSAAYTATATQFTPVGGAFDDTSSDALAEGEMGVVRLTSARAMHVAVQNSVAVTGTFYQATQPVSIASMPATPVTDNGGSLTVDGTVGISGTVPVSGTFWQATQPVSGTFWQATQPVSIASMPSTPVTGTFWQATQPVSIASMPATPVTDNGGSLTVDGTVGISGTVPVSGTFYQATQPVSIAATVSTSASGNVAHDAADSGNPVKIGGVARTATPTAVANGDRADAYVDVYGKQVVQPLAPRTLIASQATTITSSIAANTIVSAGGAGVFRDIMSLVVTNSSATATLVTLISNGVTMGVFYIPAESGMVICPAVPFTQTTANTTWTLTCGTSVASIYVVAQYVSV